MKLIVSLLMIAFVMVKPVIGQSLLKGIASPIVLEGNDSTAYRDPAVIYHESKYYLFYTLVKIESNDEIFSYVAMSISSNLKNWSTPKILTKRDANFNYSSPGNIIRFNNEWIMCVQTYLRPNYTRSQMPKYGNQDSRIYLMRSSDMLKWSEPEQMNVKGSTVSFADAGRMIDPYLLEDKDEKGKWWCFYKQNGVSKSYSYDFKNWKFDGFTESGENVCVIIKDNKYILFNAPENGISIKESVDLKHFEDRGELITLGQEKWSWAKGRITAGVVINQINNRGVRHYLMFFHGSGPQTEIGGDFDKNSSIGIAWSKDLKSWAWSDMK